MTENLNHRDEEIVGGQVGEPDDVLYNPDGSVLCWWDDSRACWCTPERPDYSGDNLPEAVASGSTFVGNR